MTGCTEAARGRCARCGRAVCPKHAGLGATPSLQRGRPAARTGLPRCALCRLDQRRAGQARLRRLWVGLPVAALALFAVLDVQRNLVQGLALLALVGVIVVMAFAYDRALRR